MTDVELRPCPCCEAAAGLGYTRVACLQRGSRPCHYVQCLSCGLQTRDRETAEEAVAAWNARPELDRLRSALQAAEQKNDLLSAQIGMIASELAGDSKLHWLNDRSDPRWTPTIQEAWSLRQKVREDAKQIVDLMHDRDAAIARAENAERERDECVEQIAAWLEPQLLGLSGLAEELAADIRSGAWKGGKRIVATKHPAFSK